MSFCLPQEPSQGGTDERQRVPGHRGDRGEQRSRGRRRHASAVATAAGTVRDLRVAEVVRQDVTIEDGSDRRATASGSRLSFKYESGD